MPTKPDNPKRGLSRHRPILKWVGRLLLVLTILLIAGFFFLPQIATRLLARFAADLDLDHFEVEVVEVTWSKATLNDLSAANADWQARADKILVQYSPWDLLRGQIQQANLTGLQIDLRKELPEAGAPSKKPLSENPPSIDDTENPSEPSFGWLQSLTEALAKCEHVTAPNTQLHISFDKTQFHKTFDLILGQDASGTPQFILKNRGNGETLSVLLKHSPSRSTLSIQASLPEPGPWLTAAESFLAADEPWLPPELVLGPIKSDIVINISDTFDLIELSGMTTDLRYYDEASDLDARSSPTTFEGTIRPSGPSQVKLQGDLSTLSLNVEALPCGPLSLTPQACPAWSVTLAWGDDPFSYSGTVKNLALQGPSDSQSLLVDSQEIAFSNRDALFQTNGILSLNGLAHPFGFTLHLETNSPNAHLTLGPVILSATHPLLPSSPEFPEIFGTFAATAALRIAPSEPISGSITLDASNASTRLPGDLAIIGPLSGTAQLTLPDNDTWQLHGQLKLSPTRIAPLLTNLSAFSDSLEGLALSGTIDSNLEFETNNEQDFHGTLQFGITDGAVGLKDTLTVSALEARGALEMASDPASPLTWKLDGSFARLDIAESASPGFPIGYDGSLDEAPASFSLAGTSGENTTIEGSISKLTLTGEQHGETVSFEDSSLKFLFTDQTLEADGATTLAGNKIPFKYRHTTTDQPDNPSVTAGKIQIPVTNLSEPITSLGAFSPSIAGMSFSGQVGATLAFKTGPDTDFGGSLDFSLRNGSLTLPDDGPALSGVAVRFQTPDLNTLHTTKPEAFSIDSINYGDLAFTKLSGRYQIQPNGDLKIPRFQSNFLGGRLTTDPFTYPADDKDFRLDLRFRSLNLRTLTTLFPAFNGRLDGTIDGHLPVVRKDGNYLPERGAIKLSPKSEARLRYDADALFTGGLNPKSAEFKSMKIAEDSLKDLRIPILIGRLFDPNDKGKAAVIRIEGKSTTVQGAPPIHLNFNIFEPQGEFQQLLDYFFKNRDKLNFGL